MIEIKNCPFCGKHDFDVLPGAAFGEYHVSCRNARCLAEGPSRRTYAGAVKAWNKRAEVEGE